MVKDREVLVLYSSSICNLKCKYCYIDKNPALIKIDKLLEQSFNGDYYIDFTKKIFPDKLQLKEVQFWGGEPSIGLGRTEYTISKLIEYYPNLNKFMMSTNLTLPEFCDTFFHFLNVLNNYPERKFIFNLQLSIDGPEYINDESRGVGTTKKFLKNYISLLEKNQEIPPNVVVQAHFKPTLDNNSIKILQTKEKIIEYYQFLDNLLHAAYIVNKSNNRFIMFESVPNTASPSPHTKEDGIRFANLCKICNEIKEEGCEKYFKHYKNIRPFGKKRKTGNEFRSFINYGNCGVGSRTIGLLPNNMISACHNGFVDLISDYKRECMNQDSEATVLDSKFFTGKDIRLTMNLDKFSKFENWMEFYYDKKLRVKNSNLSSLIQVMARCEQIDKKYADYEQAALAAEFINNTFAYCLRDNINSTGCMELPPIGEIRLLLNGAKEEMQK